MAEPSQAAQLDEFCSLTGLGAENASQRDFAQSFLEGHGWNMENAVNAYLEMKAEANAAGGADAGADADSFGPASGGGGEEQVRAPLPDRQERLFDESPEEMARRMRVHQQLLRGEVPAELGFGDAAPGSRRRGPMQQLPRGAGMHAAAGHASVDPFRNFATENSWRPAAAASSSSSSAAAPPRRPGAAAAPNLSKLFAPPDALILLGPSGAPANLETACEYAESHRKWLLVNIQQGDEFSSHQLNRDVWRSKEISALVQKHFVFIQIAHSTADGIRYKSLYHPPHIPSIALIDPETKMKLWDAHAEAIHDVDPLGPPSLREAAMRGEIIVGKPFIARLSNVLREWAKKTDLQMDSSHAGSSGAAAAAAGSNGHGLLSAAATEEERALQAAINASLAGSPAKPAAAASSSSAPSAAAPSSAAARRLDVAPSAASARPSALSTAAPASRGTKSSAIVLDDDDDDDSDSDWGSARQASDDDEEYVAIDSSDGELDARIVRRAQNGADDDDDVAILSPHATKHYGTAAAVGAKRKRVVEIDADENSGTSKLSRTVSAASDAGRTVAASSAAAASALGATAVAPPVPTVAAVPVPPEPAAGVADVCRLQIRLPGGGKPVQRRFLKSDTIKGVLAFARTLMPEDVRNKKLLLVSVHPRRELADEELSIEAAGVVNASVIVEISAEP